MPTHPSTALSCVALAGAFLLAGCSTSGQRDTGATATETVTVQASPSAPTTPSATSTTTATSAPKAAHPSTTSPRTAGPGQRCEIGKDRTVGLVVEGSTTCKTLRNVWKRAVADPNFSHHGNHNRINVDSWTCRAHQTRPLQTGFCETNSPTVKFKVIHR